jgi:hypothetical protein
MRQNFEWTEESGPQLVMSLNGHGGHRVMLQPQPYPLPNRKLHVVVVVIIGLVSLLCQLQTLTNFSQELITF